LVSTGFNRTSGWHSLRRGVALLAPIATTTTVVLLVGTVWTWLLHVVVATAVLCTLPSLYHEATHGNVSRLTPVNDAIGTVAGALHVVPFMTWRLFHLAHHANTGTDDDPEVYPRFWSRWTLITFPLTQWGFLRILWRWAIDTAGGGGPRWIRSERQRRAVRMNIIGTVGTWVVIVAVCVAAPLALLLLVLPCALSLMIASMTLVPEHFPAYRVGRGEPDQLDRTGTFHSNPVLRFVLWNSNYHAAHHFAPKVPAHHLARVDRLISRIQDPAWRWKGYAQWYRERLSQLSWTPLDVGTPPFGALSEGVDDDQL
jgi:fatty acid desaturase